MANTALLDDPTLRSARASDSVPLVFKVVVTGGFGAGETTLIRSACGDGVLSTEEPIGVLFTQSEGCTPQQLRERHKSTTTAALDFARIEMAGRRLHVFGTPGRMSFWTVWARLCDGAAAAVVVVDPYRPADSFAAVDFFETQQIPFVVAVNQFNDQPAADYRVLYEVLNLPGRVPFIQGDLRAWRCAVRVFTSLSTLLPTTTEYRSAFASHDGGIPSAHPQPSASHRLSTIGTNPMWTIGPKFSAAALALLVAGTLLLGACTSAATSSAEAGTVAIGMVVSRTGVYKTVGDDMVNGFQLFLDQHAGKLGGRTVQLAIEDEADGGEIARTLTEKLIQRNNIRALTGVVGGASVKALAPLLAQYKVPLVGSNARPTTAPEVTWMWHSSYISTEPGIAMGKYVAQTAGGPVWVVCPDYQGGYDECNGFVTEFVKAGGVVANPDGKPRWTPFPTTANFQPYLTEILASNAKAVYTFYAGAPAVAFVKQYHDFIGSKVPLFAAGFLTEGSVLAAQGDAAKGIRNSMNYTVDLDNRANRGFVADYQTKYKTMPTTFAMASYDAAAVLDKAIAAAAGAGRPVTGETINAALSTVGQIDSPRGPWTFAATTHTPIQTWYLREVQYDGKALSNVKVQELATIGG